jgi:hypothetical protein
VKAEEVRTRAPNCSKFAQELRDVFGEVRLLRLQEGDVSIGRPDTLEYATCFIFDKPKNKK